MDYTGEGIWGYSDYPEGVFQDALSAHKVGVDHEALLQAYGGYILANLDVGLIYPDIKLNPQVLGREAMANG